MSICENMIESNSPVYRPQSEYRYPTRSKTREAIFDSYRGLSVHKVKALKNPHKDQKVKATDNGKKDKPATCIMKFATCPGSSCI